MVRLFWNRTQLKREFSQLERDRLQVVQQLRQQEVTGERAQQQLEQLEGLLADPVRAANAVVYFQLRGIWAYGRRRLARLAHELRVRQQEREVQREALRFEEHRQAALAALERRLEPLQARYQELGRALLLNRGEQAGCSGWWQVVTRYRLAGAEFALLENQTALAGQMERYSRARAGKLKEMAPVPDFLGVSGQRLVNLSLIAMAQELLLVFSEHNVAQQSREAAQRQTMGKKYGDLDECRRLGQVI